MQKKNIIIVIVIICIIGFLFLNKQSKEKEEEENEEENKKYTPPVEPESKEKEDDGPTCNDLTKEQYYYHYNPDVLAAGIPALDHYIVFGKAEGRKSCYTDDDLKINTPVNSFEQCKQAGCVYLGDHGLASSRSPISGEWSHVPKGCSIQNIDNTIHWNTHLTPDPVGFGYEHDFDPIPTYNIYKQCNLNDCNTKDSCYYCGLDYLDKHGITSGRGIITGAWSHVPKGCSVQIGGDNTIHWNTHQNPDKNSEFSKYKVIDNLPDNY